MELFNKDERYTDVAIEFDRQISIAIEPIFRAYIAQGASTRTLAYIAHFHCALTSANLVLRSAGCREFKSPYPL